MSAAVNVSQLSEMEIANGMNPSLKVAETVGIRLPGIALFGFWAVDS
jgi:hypothetical protein